MGFKLFADDTQFYMAVDNIDNTEGKLKLIMDDVGKWMESKQLNLNHDKTECLIVGKNNCKGSRYTTWLQFIHERTNTANGKNNKVSSSKYWFPQEIPGWDEYKNAGS